VDKKTFERQVGKELEAKETPTSTRAFRPFLYAKFLNEDSLQRMPSEQLREAIAQLVDAAEANVRNRRGKKIRDIDTRAAIQASLCKLPPFCRRRWEG
jgi:hypothetical protein